MNTWVFLLFAVSSTIVKSDDYQGSSSSPEVIRKGYTSGSLDQVNGESSPHAIFVYTNGGRNEEASSSHQHEGSHQSLVNRPGVLHSRYVAGSREREPSENSQLNTLPLRPPERNQKYKNDRREDSIFYHSSSGSASHHRIQSDIHQHHSSHHSDNHQEHSSHHSGIHQEHSSPHSDNQQDHSIHHSDNHQHHRSLHSDMYQDHSSHNSVNNQDHSSHHSDNHQDNSSHHSENHQDHISHHSDNDQDHSSHHPNNHQHHRSHHSDNHQDHRSHNSDNHPDQRSHHSDNYQDHLLSESEPRAAYVQAPHDDIGEETRNDKKDGFKSHSSRSKPLHNSVHNSLLPQSNYQYFSVPHGTYVTSPYSGNQKQSLDIKTEDLKYYKSIGHPSVVHSGVSPNPRKQSLDESNDPATYFYPTHGVYHEESRDLQKINVKHHKPRNNPSEPNHYGFLSNPHDHRSGKSASNTNYETQKEDLSTHNPTSKHPSIILNRVASNLQDQSSEKSASRENFAHSLNEDNHDQSHRQQDHFKDNSPKGSPLVTVLSGISSNHHDQSTGISTSPHHLYEETNEKGRDNYPSDLKYPNPKNIPSTVYHSDYSSTTYNETGLQGNLYRPPQRELKSKQKEDFEYIDHPSPSSVTHHNGVQSKPTDQSSNEGNIQTVIIQPPHKKNYWETNGSRQGDIGLSAPSIPTTANDHQKYKESHSSIGEIHKGNNEQLEHLRYKDVTDFPQNQKESFANSYVRNPDKTPDHTRYHHGDVSHIRPETEYNGHNQMYESHVPFHSSTELPQAKHEYDNIKNQNTYLIVNQPFSKYHKSKSYSSQDVPEHSVNHHESSGYVSYSGPYTKPQVLHDIPNTHEIASATVVPFGTPKAQPPEEFQPSSILNSQYPAEHSSRNVQTHSFSEHQHRENQNYNLNTRNYGIPENGYSQFSPQDLYNYSTETPKYQRQQPNKSETKNLPATVRSHNYEGYIKGNNNVENYSFGHNKNPVTYSGSPPQYSYAVPVISSQTVQDNLNSYIPYNYTVNGQFRSVPSLQTKPYSYEGEYVNRLGSNNNAYHTGNQLGSTPQAALKNIIPQVLHDRRNSTDSISFLSMINQQTPTNYQSDGSSSNRYFSELIGHSRPEEQNVRQVPLTNYQVVQDGPNNTNSEYIHAVVRPTKNGGYHNGNGHSYSTEHNKDTRIQQKYTSQAQPELNQQFWQNAHLSNSHLVTSTAESFVPARTVQVNAGQQVSNVYTKNHPLVDHLDPGIHHEYALKFSFNKPKLTPQPLHFTPNSNQSEHFAVNSAPSNYVGYLESSNQHPSGLVRLIDPQQVYAPHMPYHALPAVKPIVLQTGYQEDTHEISHAKHDHLHVHHSSQSGYQYGIIN